MTDLGPLFGNGVVANDSAQLADIRLRVGAHGFSPDRPCLIYAGSPAGQAVEIGKCVGVVVGQTAGWVDDAVLVDVDKLFEHMGSG